MLGIRRLLSVALLAALAAGCNGARAAQTHHENTQPGDLALDYIRGNRYPNLKVEVDFISGEAPNAQALERVRDLWRRRIEKNNVDIFVDTEIPESFKKTTLQIGDILALESQFRDHSTGDKQDKDTAVIWMVYLNGGSEFDQGDTRALGVAYGGSEVAIFRDNINDTTASGSAAETVETMVLAHEGGHLFGLVNNGIPMVNDHEDRANPRHCSNANCVMFHEIETSAVGAATTVDYDFNCRLDMAAAGGVPADDPTAAESEPALPLTLGAPARETGRGPIPDMAKIRSARR